MSEYKGHPIYGIGFRGAGDAWNYRGLVFDCEGKVNEIKRLENAEVTFTTKAKAETHGLQQCKHWIDEKNGVVSDSGLTPSARQKAGVVAM